MSTDKKYVAFLRGINVGGHHKVAMADLRKEMERLNFKNVSTLLNSGNIIFETSEIDLEPKISSRLEASFGFPIPTLIRSAEKLNELLTCDPFKKIIVTKDIRLYVSFLQKAIDSEVRLPWTSEDGSYIILEQKDQTLFSVLDLSISNTPKAMEGLEKRFGKEITTRNWNTLERIGKKIF